MKTFSPTSAQSVVLQQSPTDYHLLDIRRAFTDEQHRRLAIEPLDLVLLGVSVAAVDAERVSHHLGAVLGRQQLGHAGLKVVALAGVLEAVSYTHLTLP